MSELVDVLKNSTLILTGITGLIVALYKLVTGLGTFHDRPFTRRNFRRLEMLERKSGNNPGTLEMLTMARNEEIYRSLFGWHAPPASMDAMTDLIRTRQFAIADLKAAHTYMKVEHGRVTVKIGIGTWLIFWFLLSMVIMLGILVMALAAALMTVPTMENILATLATAIVYAIFCYATAPEARSVIVGHRVRDKLARMTSTPQD